MAAADERDEFRTQALRVCTQNLSLLKRRQADLDVEFNAISAELAHALQFLGAGDSDGGERQLLRKTAETLPKNADVRASFCTKLAGVRGEWTDVSSYIPENEVGRSPLVAYFRNSTSNTAFSRFEKIIPELRAAYFDDFSQICEETAAGRCDLCMLPVYDVQNGTLRSVRRLIERYDLHKIASVSLQIRQDSEEKVEFALFSPEFRKLPGAKTLSLGAVFEDEKELPALLEGMTALGADCTFCDRLPPELFEEIAYDLDFNLENAQEEAVCLCLSLFYPRVSGKGVYLRL